MLKSTLHRKRLTADIQIPAISDAKCYMNTDVKHLVNILSGQIQEKWCVVICSL